MKKWNIGNLWKKYKYVGLVVLAGILLMLLPGKKSDAQTQEGGGSFSWRTRSGGWRSCWAGWTAWAGCR